MTHTAWRLLHMSGQLRAATGDLERLALMLGSLCHDLASGPLPLPLHCMPACGRASPSPAPPPR